MKNEPCIRLGIRISPKIKENPADNRNSKPPKAMLFTARVSQSVMCDRSYSAASTEQLDENSAGGEQRRSSSHAHSLQIPSRRIIASIDRVGQKFLFVIGPELTDVRVALDRCVDQLSVLALAFADEDVAHDVAEVVELDRPARRIGKCHLVQCLGQCVAVVGFGPKLLDRRLYALAGDVHAGCVTA